MRTLGAVLVGGRSSRFGSDKAQAFFGDRTLGEHAAGAIRPHVDEVVLVGGDVMPDLPQPGLGPLGGIAAALDHAASHGFANVLTIGCDMPRVPGELIAALLRRSPSFCRDVPVLGYWCSAAGAHLLAHIEIAPNRAVIGWAEALGALPIASPVPLANVNTREDLMAL